MEIKMRKGRSLTGLILFCRLSLGPALADEISLPSQGWGSFQFNALQLFQAGGGQVFTGQLSWTPGFRIASIPLRGELGVSVPRNAIGDRFLAFHYQLFYLWSFRENARLEPGLGFQTYTAGNGGTHGLLSLDVVFVADAGFIDRLFAGYSLFLHPNTVHGIRLGVGF